MAVKTTAEERAAMNGETLSADEFDKRIADIERKAADHKKWFMASRVGTAPAAETEKE